MKTKLQNEWYWHAFLLIAVFLMLWPIVFMISTSLKDLNQVFESTLNPLPFPPTFDNYTTVLHNFPLLTYTVENSFLVFEVVIHKGKGCQYTCRCLAGRNNDSNIKRIPDIGQQREVM